MFCIWIPEYGVQVKESYSKVELLCDGEILVLAGTSSNDIKLVYSNTNNLNLGILFAI